MASVTQESQGQIAAPVTNWTPIVGKWNIVEGRAQFSGYDDPSFKIGIALADLRATSGRFRAKVELTETEEGCAHLVIGHSAENLSGFTIGLGGFGKAYSITEYFIHRGSRKVFALGPKENLQPGRTYQLEVVLRGQSVRLIVDGVGVLDYTLPHPLSGDQFGIKGHGEGRVDFSEIYATLMRPRAFVVMQFGEPYDSLWKEVIKPVADKAGFEAYRADDVFRPGIILQDIVRGIVTSDVIVAEVTPRNPNVFYELGFAHALGKPAILMAARPLEKGVSLPFDISGFRCIFYDDAIRGKRKVEEELARHLNNIREREEEEVIAD